MGARARQVMLSVVLIGLALLVWWPLWFMAIGAFLPIDELRAYLGPISIGGDGFVYYPLLPSFPTLQPLVELLLDTPEYFVMFWNSCRLVFPVLCGQVLVGAPAAWALAHLRFRGRNLLFTLYLGLMLLPFQVTMVSAYLVIQRLGLLDTRLAVVLPGVFSALPVFIMVKGFQTVPRSLLEAAVLDGATPFQVFWRIGLPLGRPGIISALVIGFLEQWSALEQPMVFLKNPALWPLSLHLPRIVGENIGLAMVSSLIGMAPAILVFLFGQKYLELGIRASGLKE